MRTMSPKNDRVSEIWGRGGSLCLLCSVHNCISIICLQTCEFLINQVKSRASPLYFEIKFWLTSLQLLNTAWVCVRTSRKWTSLVSEHPSHWLRPTYFQLFQFNTKSNREDYRKQLLALALASMCHASGRWNSCVDRSLTVKLTQMRF